jgi:N-acyl-phosphatidylethanolamine-hydrolysing phospholipase D
MPSVSDAWLAYKKGAAVALHPKKTRKWTEDEGIESSDEEEADQVDENGAIRGEPGYILPGIYIRPELARIQREDEAEDWRDPPVDVVKPDWGGTNEGKENVTWLGHAGVLVRVPWKKNVEGREGMCGILFDPIFSQRCSPSQYVGPSRYVDPPCTVSLLPEIHLCFISHDHCKYFSPTHQPFLTV